MANKELKKHEDYNRIILFEDSKIRRVYFDDEWYYVIEDIVALLSESKDPKGYLKDMRRRNKTLSEGWGQIATLLPIMTMGGRQNTNCASNEGIFRIIQEIPSSKAEPFKKWLARVGKERLEEIEQPEKAIERGKGYYKAKGYSQQWIETRTASIDNRHKFTETLKESGIKKGYEYAVLTNELYSSSFGLSANEYKNHKSLEKNQSLRDNMTPLELASVIFSEATSTELITQTGAKGFVETKKAIHIAGSITKEAIEKLERKTGKKVVTHENAQELNSPEIMKELAQDPMKEEPLSPMDEGLKKMLGNKPI